ncbi:DUF2125 domain-containing protein [Amaricoccus solimangrovi]|uniref:DUF2125 domain-containing protein n=1 Tax=Amaricoccus solimangrovi TaxID=2589815 RepID=A0A501WZ92_9RHOB|nr:DUF2125 domain-containing protein [Amaricoccus solimangrovi]TPE53724.1 DUF2125 domain-containing protein [Amaricoccus solimangrovi]
MRVLLAIVVLAALGWGGFWYWNASMRERALSQWLEERRAAGWVAEGDVRVTGFPNRVDSIVTGLDLANPAEGWSWTAAELQILSQTWKPHHIIAVWPGQQSVATPAESIAVTSSRMVGSVVFEPNLRLGLDHSTVELRDVALAGTTGWKAGLGEALFSVRRSPDAEAAPFSYDVDFNAKRLSPPEAWTARIAELLPGTVDLGHLAATLTFDKPWDRPAIEGKAPALRAVDLAEARVSWGDLDLTASGKLGVDARGFAEGRLDLVAKDWRGMLDVAERAGAIGEGLARGLRGALGLYASLSGGGDTLRAPLEFRDGETMLGPVPVGPAPLLAPGG